MSLCGAWSADVFDDVWQGKLQFNPTYRVLNIKGLHLIMEDFEIAALVLVVRRIDRCSCALVCEELAS